MFVQKLKSQKKFYQVFLAVFVSALFFTQTVFAYVGYQLLSVPAYQQEMSNWCWAASTEMAANFLGANSTQTAIVTYVKGSPVNVTGSVSDIQKGLSYYNVKSTTLLTYLSFQTVINEINLGEPIIAAVEGTSGGGHAVVIRGYYQDTSVPTNNLYYIDPSDASYNIVDYSTFVSNSQYYWVNTVHAIYV